MRGPVARTTIAMLLAVAVTACGTRTRSGEDVAATTTPATTAAPVTAADPTPAVMDGPTPAVDGSATTTEEATPLAATAPDIGLLAVKAEDLPIEIGLPLTLGEVVEDPMQEVDGQSVAALDFAAALLPTCSGSSLDWTDDAIGWHAVSLTAGEMYLEDAPETLPILNLVQGLAARDDAAAVMSARRAEVADCQPADHLLGPDTTSLVARLDPPNLGNGAVAWRSVTAVPHRWVFSDSIWWQHADGIAAVMLTWHFDPGSLSPSPGDDTVSETVPATGWADTGERMAAALWEVAERLDDRL